MARKEVYFILIIAFAASCSLDKHAKDGLASIDITKTYPEKEIFLTDIADVTYLSLNSDDDDYFYQGRINCLTEKTVVVYDNASGGILFFSRDGKPKSRFNCKGQGPEEYANAYNVIYDEASDDLFVILSHIIMVYSSKGEFKRKITLPEGMRADGRMVSFDEHSFLFYDLAFESKIMMDNEADLPVKALPYYRISKTDGEVLDCVEIPYAPIILGMYREDLNTVVRGRTSRTVKCKEGVLLCNPETDTVYLYGKDRILTPVIRKTPPVSALEPMAYLNNCVDAGGYQFMEVFTIRIEQGATPYPVEYFMRDKETGEIFRQKILLPEYKGKEFFISPLKSGRDYENGPYFELDLAELKQAYDEDKLSGQLKELVAALDENKDNNIFMLVHFK